jgi:hypothetical protein
MMMKTYSAALLGTALMLSACERAPFQPSELQDGADLAHPTVSEAAGGRATAEMNRQIAATRQATARYHDITVAAPEGYVQISPCVTVPGVGGMGIHYANPTLLQDRGFNPTEPEMLLYLPGADGSMKLIGIEYAVAKPAWHADGTEGAPVFMGHTFDVLPGSEAEGRPDLYTLHAWIWLPNPAGMFAPFNPRVACPAADDAGGHSAHVAG